MSIKLNKTQFPGVRFRENSSRKHNGKPDRYFTIRYKLNGILKEEGLGWSSQGWNAQKTSITRNDLIKKQKLQPVITSGKAGGYDFTIMVVGLKATPTKMAPAIAEIPVVPMMNPP
jgi:hypothetical protein